MEKKKKKIKNRKIKGLSSIMSAMLQSVSTGTVWPMGNYTAYLVSYLREFSPSLRLEHGYFLLPTLVVFLFIFGVFGAFIEEKLGIIRTVLLGQTFIIGGAALMYISKNIYYDYMIMSLYGFGIGISTFIITKNACMYYPKKRGFVRSCIGVFSNIACAAFNGLGEKMINGNETKGDPYYPFEVAKNIKDFFLFQGCCMAIITLFSVFFIVPYEGGYDNEEDHEKEEISDKITKIASEGLFPKDINDIDQEEGEKEKDERPGPDESFSSKMNYSVRHVGSAIKSWRVWRLCIISFFSSFCFNVLGVVWRQVGLEKGIPEKFLQLNGTGGFIISCISTPIWGFLADMVPFRVSMGFITLGLSFTGFFFYFSFSNPWIFLSILLSNSFLFSGWDNSFTPHIMKVFGIKYSVEIGGLISFFSALSGVLGCVFAFLAEMLIKDSNVSYIIMFFLSGGFSVVAFVFCLFESDKPFEYGF